MYRNPETGKYEKKFFFELKHDTFVGKPKDEVTREFNEEVTVTDGIVRWNNSNNVVPKDWLYDFRDLGLIPTEFIESSLVAKDIDTTKFVKEYIDTRKKWAKEDPEGYAEAQREMQFEARAAMGPGEDMVNVITGEKFTT
jgi:hypothetical protein